MSRNECKNGKNHRRQGKIFAVAVWSALCFQQFAFGKRFAKSQCASRTEQASGRQKAGKHMTLEQAQEQASRLGMSISKRDGEYRVNFKFGTEDTAYYTDDLEDAVGTVVAMIREKLAQYQCSRLA